MAEKYGKVVIITNSAPGWLDTSCAAFMPTLHPKIRQYPIFAKPISYLLTYKLDVFKRELGHRYSNLISIGDGIAERTATLRLIGRDWGFVGFGGRVLVLSKAGKNQNYSEHALFVLVPKIYLHYERPFPKTHRSTTPRFSTILQIR